MLEQFHVARMSPSPSQKNLSCSPEMRDRDLMDDESRPNH